MVELRKGAKSQNLDLGRSKIMVGLGWQNTAYQGLEDFDLDLSVFMLFNDTQVAGDDYFVFYGKLQSPCGSIVHTGDEKQGGEEMLYIDFTKVPAYIQRLVIAATIYDGERKGQCFGQVNNAYLHLMRVDSRNQPQGGDVLRFDLTEDYSTETALVVGEIYRSEDGWRFYAVGGGYEGGLVTLCRKYGVNIKE